MTSNPEVSLHFLWLELQRQVSINGRVEPGFHGANRGLFCFAPFGSQIGAWVSPQSQVVSSKSLLLAKYEEMKRKFAEGKVPLPSFWGGYAWCRVSLNSGRADATAFTIAFAIGEHDDVWFHERLAP